MAKETIVLNNWCMKHTALRGVAGQPKCGEPGTENRIRKRMARVND